MTGNTLSFGKPSHMVVGYAPCCLKMNEIPMQNLRMAASNIQTCWDVAVRQLWSDWQHWTWCSILWWIFLHFWQSSGSRIRWKITRKLHFLREGSLKAYCIPEGIKDNERKFLKTYSTLGLLQDESRKKAPDCGASNLNISAQSGLFGISKTHVYIDWTHRDNRWCLEIILHKAAWPVRVLCPPKNLFHSLCQIVEAILHHMEWGQHSICA